MSKILGLDLGTNSIGWAVVSHENKQIEGAGSRIIPLDGEITSNYEKGNAVSQTGDRTQKRLARRMTLRFQLRRERLLRVLRTMGFLPEHYAAQLDRYGHFLDHGEPKLAWREGKDGGMEFLFQASFEEMLRDFAKSQPDMLADGRKVPYDWTIYYLRHKALRKALTKEELAWVLLQFNQKRGYNKLRGEDENDAEDKKKEILRQRVTSVTEDVEAKGKRKRFRIVLENGMAFDCDTPRKPDWEGLVKEFVVTTSLDKDGNEKKDKDGNVVRSFRAPDENDWTLMKLRTEEDIKRDNVTVGEYIYSSLLADPDQKIVGQLVRTIDRKFYLDEAHAILKKQADFIPELKDEKLYAACVEELYGSNEAYRNSIAQRGFTYLLADDTLFYQRPLKSKKSLIADCPYESRKYVVKETGEEIALPVKCTSKSHPLFQEFRLWQFIGNLKIYKKDENKVFESDVTSQFLPDGEARACLFDWLRDRASIDQKAMLQYPPFNIPKVERDGYRWNYVEDKSYPANETRANMLKALKKAGVDAAYLSQEKEEEMWHLLYSITNAAEMQRAAEKYAKRNKLGSDFVTEFCRIKPYAADYAAYSLKAIKKLLPLMRMGHRWSEQDIDAATQQRIQGLVDGTLRDKNIERIRQRDKEERKAGRAREAHFNYRSLADCQGLPVWEACYVAYGRHSEGLETQRWERPEDIDAYLARFRQHSLRNPIVEQVATETLRTVRDIWRQFGRPDEIHLEVGREMKQTAEERKRATARNTQNELTNMRIRLLLTMLADPECDVENVRPFSPTQQEILKIYEQGALEASGGINDEAIKDVFARLSSLDASKQPTVSEVLRYKAWLEQHYRSPYTGKTISLSRLFTEDYEIEHVIPQACYFDDSMLNKVVCEAEVNHLKGARTAHEFIVQCHGQMVELPGGRSVKVFEVEEYESFVRENYKKNRAKQERMMLDDVPDNFINRQLNDSRYISRFLMSVLSNVVRTVDKDGTPEPDAISKNLIVVTGNVTDRLKSDWHLKDQWNKIILPRFERLEKMTESNKELFGQHFVATTREGHRIPRLPVPQQNFNFKRIDHRHHAMDAITIACATREHVNLLSNEAALTKDNASRLALSHKLRQKETWLDGGKERERFGNFKLPWPSMPLDTLHALQNVVVSFKKDLRVVTRTKNLYRRFEEDEHGKLHRKIVLQEGRNLAIRKPLHKDTVFGEVKFRLTKTVKIKDALANPGGIVDKELRKEVKRQLDAGRSDKEIIAYFKQNNDMWPETAAGKVSVYYKTEDTNERYFASRYGNSLVNLLGATKTQKEAEKKIESITDTGIRKILLAHLAAEGNDPQVAFCAEGIDRMNANIVALNGGHQHKPIRTVRCFERANKFAVGTVGNKGKKYVEGAKGTNLFYLLYSAPSVPDKPRIGLTLPLRVVIQLQKKYSGLWREHVVDELSGKESGLFSMDELAANKLLIPKDAKALFFLSPNDLVYCPSKEERASGVKEIDRRRIYKIVSFGDLLYGLPDNVSDVIVKKVEFESHNKMTKTLDGDTIRDVCLPLAVDRLGNVKLVDVD